MAEQLPILYSFRRCPYAMRARMAIRYSMVQVELREVVLKNKPQAMLEASPKATVPVLVLSDRQVIDESRDVMMWALKQSDKANWYFGLGQERQFQIDQLLDINDNDFKPNLDKYKYAVRFPEFPEITYRQQGEVFLSSLEQRLANQAYLCGDQLCLTDIAIFPFIRQFAHVDIQWFEQSDYHNLQKWLNRFKASELFKSIMDKYPAWRPGDTRTVF